MGNHTLRQLEYGYRYYQTRTITDLALLAERILADLPFAGTEYIPAGTEFGIHVHEDVLLHLHVGGLSDEFTFADRLSYRYTEQATQLVGRLCRSMESYNWINRDDPADRRFCCSVHLLAESDYRSSVWTPGVVRIF
jgi:hypothetical protein